MSLELSYGLKSRRLRAFVVYFPDIAFALDCGSASFTCNMNQPENTLLFPATRHWPSEAMLTDRIGTSPAGACPVKIFD